MELNTPIPDSPAALEAEIKALDQRIDAAEEQLQTQLDAWTSPSNWVITAIHNTVRPARDTPPEKSNWSTALKSSLMTAAASLVRNWLGGKPS